MEEIRSYLEKYFPQLEHGLMEKIAATGSVRVYNRDEVIMQSGRYIKFTLLVVDGLVKLYRENDEGKEYFIYYLEPGDACALSLICAARNQQSQITAIAQEETTAILIPLEIMDELMRDYRTWYYFVLQTYRTRFEELLNVIDDIAFKNMDARLESYLSDQFRDMKTNLLQITHQQIANDLNSTREVISRLLKKMEQNGKIKLHRNAIEMAKSLA